MNGFVHGVQFVNGFANYNYILIAWDVMATAGVVVLTIVILKTLLKRKEKELNKQ